MLQNRLFVPLASRSGFGAAIAVVMGCRGLLCVKTFFCKSLLCVKDFVCKSLLCVKASLCKSLLCVEASVCKSFSAKELTVCKSFFVQTLYHKVVLGRTLCRVCSTSCTGKCFVQAL